VPLLLLADAPTTDLPAWLAARFDDRWSLAAVAAASADPLGHLRARLTEPSALLLVDVADAATAESALAALDTTLCCGRWLALLPAGSHEAGRWWALGAADAVARDDEPGLERALHRALVQASAQAAAPARVQALQASIHAMQASLDNIPAPIFAKNAQGRYTGCNQAFVDFLGLPREQIIGKTVHDVAPAHLAEVYDQADRKLLASGGRQVYEAQVRWADGALRDVIFHKAVFRDAQGQVAGQAGAIFDITDRKRLEHGLRELAQTDPLTGLLNRRCFIERATAALDEARVTRAPVAVLLFDIDHFKQINDNHGHAAGDAMLCHLSRLGRQQLRGDDLMARIGGDEFAILLTGPADARAVATRLPASIAATPLDFEGRELRCAISLGAAVVLADDHDIDTALRQADAALYEAKRQGRAQAVVFDSSL
jgi:diguanylate cyclase (GGDEF)-like protein/PAS domain S-box-containing protein